MSDGKWIHHSVAVYISSSILLVLDSLGAPTSLFILFK